MRELRNIGKKKKLIIKDDDNNVMTTEKDQILIVSEYFKKMLAPTNYLTEIKTYPPAEMRYPFNKEEIQKIVLRIRNGKSAGMDGLNAEFLKYAPLEIHQDIANLLNDIAKTGIYPEEMNTGLLSPLQKPPPKVPGPAENLRPIILLSVLRKITTVSLMDRIYNRLSPFIPPEQAAYQPGRSTTEHIHAIKLLAEKAVISNDYKIYLLLLDMSKAFDTVNRKILFENLEQILEADELHLLHILTNTPNLKVKINNVTGEKFQTLIGIMQGDCLSAILFIFYLSCSLKIELNIINDPDTIIPLKYADDITYASTEPTNINIIENHVTCKLQQYDLQINISKREQYEIPQPPPSKVTPTIQQLLKHKEETPVWSDLDWLVNFKAEYKPEPNWKKCKILGSLLDTKEDIQRRKSLTLNASNKMNYIFKSNRIGIKLKIRTFITYVSSVYLYNSELWALTPTMENEIDAFHRRLLRYAIGISWPDKITNKRLYNITKVEKWSKSIKRRRLNWLGHLMRLPENTPVRRCLKQHLTYAKKPRGRPQMTWLKNIKKDLKTINININLNNADRTIDILRQLTLDRKEYKNTIRMLMQ